MIPPARPPARIRCPARAGLGALVAAFVSGCAGPAQAEPDRPVAIEERAPPSPADTAAVPASEAPDPTPGGQPQVQEGPVTWYGPRFAGRRTASGERFDPGAHTMAHRTLPFDTWVRVTHLGNQRSVVVRVNDRGPFVPGRIADLTQAAARDLRMLQAGTARVRLEVLPSPPPGTRRP